MIRSTADLIMDIGLHKGEDTAYYLKKGFRVVAIEADPALVRWCIDRFRSEISNEQLFVVEGALSECGGSVEFYQSDNPVWGTICESWCDRNASFGAKNRTITVPVVDLQRVLERYGVPHYIKVDIEGSEMVVLNALKRMQIAPKFISIESEKVRFSRLIEEFRMLRHLGYRRFKIVQQNTIPGSMIETATFRGDLITYRFEEHSSGPYGDDIKGPWISASAAIMRYALIFVSYKLWGDRGVLNGSRAGRRLQSLCSRMAGTWLPGWYDTHAAL